MDEAHWSRVRRAEQTGAGSAQDCDDDDGASDIVSAAERSQQQQRPSPPATRHLRRASVVSPPAAAADGNTLVVRCKARSRRSRQLLERIAQMMEEAEEGSGDEEDEGATSAPAVSNSTPVAPSIARAGLSTLAEAVPVPRNVTPVLPFVPLPPSNAASAMAAGAVVASAVPVAMASSGSIPIAWADPDSTAARTSAPLLPVGTAAAAAADADPVAPCLTPTKAENLLLHPFAAGSVLQAEAEAQAVRQATMQRTPSLVLFHASAAVTPATKPPSPSPSPVAIAPLFVAKPRAAAAPAVASSPSILNFLSPAKVMQSPSSTSLQPLDSSRSVMLTPSSMLSSNADATPERAAQQQSFCFMQQHGEEEKVDAAFISAVDAVSQEDAAAQAPVPILSPLHSASQARAAKEQLDAVVPAPQQQQQPADGEGAHACCTIM